MASAEEKLEINMDEELLRKIIDPSSKLMTRFKELAPGSYKHCQNVSTLLDAIAKELGLDVNLMRACGMLHDIGKIFNAKYFTENQDETNVHDDLEPMVSFQLISRHISDTCLILSQQPEIPKKLIQIVSEHHGDSVIVPFYKKANEKTRVDESHYRYKSSKPQSMESAVLMIVDAVEATSRSMAASGLLDEPGSRKELVDKTVDRLVDDEQLDELTMGAVRRVKAVLTSELDAVYHKRVTYPDDEKEVSNKKSKSE